MANPVCPRCGATMEPTMIGATLKDKVLKCGHCGHQVDVPDEHEVRRVEERSSGGGRFERVETVERRRDLPAPPLPTDGAPRPVDFSEMLLPGGKTIPLPPGTKLDGLRFVQGADGSFEKIVTGDGAEIPLPPEMKGQKLTLPDFPAGFPAFDGKSFPLPDSMKPMQHEFITTKTTVLGDTSMPAEPGGFSFPASPGGSGRARGPEFQITFAGGPAMLGLIGAVVVLGGIVVWLVMTR